MMIDWAIHCFDRLESTQITLKDMAEQGAVEGTVVHALTQDGGYGRFKRQWVSSGGNLYLSFLLKPHCAVHTISQLSFVVSLAAANTIQDYIKDPDIIRLKWPNDVLMNGQKCSGILIEIDTNSAGDLNWVAAGIGVNVMTSPPDMGAAIKEYGKNENIDLIDFRDALLMNIAKTYDLWRHDGFTPIRDKWLLHGFEDGQNMTVQSSHGRLQGAYKGLDESGNLLLETKDKIIEVITSGDVEMTSGA